ncbi:hypothetical protein ISS07_05695 [Candidatus Woesearchaeota archaeon]|nr:hypothetical protein [Candidatus Woesearchaeota archaeon]
MALSKKEKENIKHAPKTEHKIGTVKEKKSNKKLVLYSVFSLIGILIIFGSVYGYVQSTKPGIYDDFAKCLTEKGAVMYGASFCKYTHGQKGMFGNSMKHINYQDFTEDSNIKLTPTWKIEGKYYENAQSFETLSKLTGCSIN